MTINYLQIRGLTKDIITCVLSEIDYASDHNEAVSEDVLNEQIFDVVSNTLAYLAEIHDFHTNEFYVKGIPIPEQEQ